MKNAPSDELRASREAAQLEAIVVIAKFTLAKPRGDFAITGEQAELRRKCASSDTV